MSLNFGSAGAGGGSDGGPAGAGAGAGGDGMVLVVEMFAFSSDWSLAVLMQTHLIANTITPQERCSLCPSRARRARRFGCVTGCWASPHIDQALNKK